jgi:hypothetical protein
MRAVFYDGVTADRHEVEVELDGDALGWGSERVPLVALSVADEDRQRLVLSRKEYSGWRLIFEQPVDSELRARLPHPSRYGSWIDRVGLVRASLVLAAVAGAVVLVGYAAPAFLAPLVPESWERNLGTAMVGDFGDNACRSPAATKALAAMAGRIDPASRGRQPITTTLIDVGIFNAAALPGGQIVIFDGALRETKNPDAMAGVLAHEIAHVHRRHVTQALIRELGIGALIRLFAGDVGANAEQLVSLSYTRANEYEADGDAIASLARAKVDPRPTAQLFYQLDKDDGEDFAAAEFLNSHPASGDRARRFAAAFRNGAGYSPVISAADYKAMRTACPAKHDAEREREEAEAKK